MSPSQYDEIKDDLKEIRATLREVIDCLRGCGKDIGLVAEVKLNTILTQKHDLALFGNGKRGVVSVIEELSRAFGKREKVLLAFVIAVVSAIGGAIGSFVVSFLDK